MGVPTSELGEGEGVKKELGALRAVIQGPGLRVCAGGRGAGQRGSARHGSAHHLMLEVWHERGRRGPHSLSARQLLRAGVRGRNYSPIGIAWEPPLPPSRLASTTSVLLAGGSTGFV